MRRLRGGCRRPRSPSSPASRPTGNLVELAHLQEHVAGALGAPVGRLTLHVKTAHIYAPEWELMANISGAVAAAR